VPEALRIAVVITRPGFHSYMVPLGYLYVAAAMRDNGGNVKVINATEQTEQPENYIRDELAAFRPDVMVAGTSFKFHNNCPSSTISGALAAARAAKQVNDNCVTLLIGPLNTAVEETLLQEPAVDALALGEAEDICRAVMNAVAENRSLNEVPGLSLRIDGNITRTGSTPHPDPDMLPFPGRDMVSAETFIFDSYFARNATEVLTSRGCPFNCTYCFGARDSRRHDSNTGALYRCVSPERVVEEIDLLYNNWGIRGIKFSDIEFCVSSSRVERICELLLARGYKDLFWRVVTRVTSVGPDLLNLMHEAGCRNIYYGVESGDPGILRAMGKEITLDGIREAFRDTWNAGIKPEASFLLGFPGETEDSIRRTISFACEIDPFLATFHVFVPFPGVPMEKELGDAVNAGLDDWNVYRLKSNRSYCDISPENLEKWTRTAYRRLYGRPKSIGRLIAELRNSNMRRYAINAVLGDKEGGWLPRLLLGRRGKPGAAA